MTAAEKVVYERAYHTIRTLHPTCEVVLFGCIVKEKSGASVHISLVLPSEVREAVGESDILALQIRVEAAIAEAFGLSQSDIEPISVGLQS
jgi:hypothetical protein